MKKLICILFSLTILITSTFADKSRFYENGKVIDTMYVDSKDGLRVRDYPSLKSNKICSLTHRFPVKVVAVGKEETIDGITAPWVEILIPCCCYEWKSDEAEFGWVFGAYLSEKQPKFIAPENEEELKQYLGYIELFDEYEYDNKSGEYYKFIFFYNYEAMKGFWRGRNGSTSIGVGGNWYAVSNNKILLWNKENDDTQVLSCVFEDDGSFYYDNGEITKYCYPSFPEWYVRARSDYGQIRRYYSWERLYQTSDNGNFLVYCANLDHWSDKNCTQIEIISELIRFGFSAKGTKYEQQYHDYWNPIMAEHQKKADAMK